MAEQALWMACHTQEEIAERESVTKETISAICQKMAELPKSDKPAADRLTDCDPASSICGWPATRRRRSRRLLAFQGQRSNRF
jgi:hypothetical protein